MGGMPTLLYKFPPPVPIPSTRRNVRRLETELTCLQNEYTYICIMFDSLRNAFYAKALQQPSQFTAVPVLYHRQGRGDINREMLAAYDDLTLKLRQLERKVEKLESELCAVKEQLTKKRRLNDNSVQWV